MDFDQFIESLKPFTKIYLVGALLIGILTTMKLVSPLYLVMQAPDYIYHVL